MDTNDSNFIGGLAGSLRNQQTGLDPNPSGANSLHVTGCALQLEFELLLELSLMEESLYQKGQR